MSNSHAHVECTTSSAATAIGTAAEEMFDATHASVVFSSNISNDITWAGNASEFATATITVTDAGQCTTNNQITMITGRGDTVTITGHADTNAMSDTTGASSNGTFAAGNTLSGGSSNNNTQAAAIAATLNLHDDIIATVASAVVTITQRIGGAAGNSSITLTDNGGDGDISSAMTVVNFTGGAGTVLGKGEFSFSRAGTYHVIVNAITSQATSDRVQTTTFNLNSASAIYTAAPFIDKDMDPKDHTHQRIISVAAGDILHIKTKTAANTMGIEKGTSITILEITSGVFASSTVTTAGSNNTTDAFNPFDTDGDGPAFSSAGKIANGITFTGNAGSMTVPSAGKYLIMINHMFAAGGSTNSNIAMLLKKGSTVLLTNTLRLHSTVDPTEHTMCVIESLAASDVLTVSYDIGAGRCQAALGATFTVYRLQESDGRRRPRKRGKDLYSCIVTERTGESVATVVNPFDKDSLLGAQATVTVADGDAASGMTEKESMTITSTDGTVRKYVIIDDNATTVATGAALTNTSDTGAEQAGEKATATITVDNAGEAVAGGTISVITTAGDTVTITGHADTNAMADTAGASTNGTFAAGNTPSNTNAQATARITVTNAGECTTNNQISVVTTAGDTVTITGHADTNAMSDTTGASTNGTFAAGNTLSNVNAKATATITVTDAGQCTTNNQISLVTTAGATVTITGHADTNAMGDTTGASTNGTFAAGNTLSGGSTNNNTQAAAIAATINLHDDFSATAASAVVTITQLTGGTGGNTNITIADNGGDGDISLAMTVVNFSGGTSPQNFQAAAIATTLNLHSDITATSSDNVVTITQNTGGTGGNTNITLTDNGGDGDISSAMTVVNFSGGTTPNNAQATAIATTLNLHDDLTATSSGAVVTITQNSAGAAGNTSLAVSSGDMVNATTLANFSGGSDVTANSVAVAINTTGSTATQNGFLVQLKAAIESSAGHNGKIVVSAVPGQANGAQAITLTQDDAGPAGNVTITDDISQTTLAGFVNGDDIFSTRAINGISFSRAAGTFTVSQAGFYFVMLNSIVTAASDVVITSKILVNGTAQVTSDTVHIDSLPDPMSHTLNGFLTLKKRDVVTVTIDANTSVNIASAAGSTLTIFRYYPFIKTKPGKASGRIKKDHTIDTFSVENLTAQYEANVDQVPFKFGIRGAGTLRGRGTIPSTVGLGDKKS